MSGTIREQEIRDWVAEIMICGFPGTTLDAHVKQLIEKHQIRNFILFARNVASREQALNLTKSLRKFAVDAGMGETLIICKDQENGTGSRLSADIPGLPCNMALGAAGMEENARRMGQVMGRQLQSVGVDMNLAPVLDVNNNAQNPVIGVRSFSEHPEQVATLGVAMIQGLQSTGVIACAKHFPGHGDTATDSHHALPVVGHHRSRLDTVELVPFRAAIEAGVDVIMTAHVVFPAVDPSEKPATLSSAVLTDFLRGELGYQGVITTDCLEMNAISAGVGVAEGAVQAVAAGADFIMVSHTLELQEAAIEALVEAVRTGRLSSDRIQDAARRVRRLRERVANHTDCDVVALGQTAIALREDICPQAVTLVSDDALLIPVDAIGIHRVAVVVDGPPLQLDRTDPHHPAELVPAAIRECIPTVTVDTFFGAEESSRLRAESSAYDLVLLVVQGLSNPAYIHRLSEIVALDSPVVVLAVRTPYDLAALPRATSFALYECTPWMVKAGVQAIFNRVAGGRLPVTVSTEMPRGWSAS